MPNVNAARDVYKRQELRFFVLEAATLQKGASSVDVLVEAETEGSRYNVPAGQITRLSLIHIFYKMELPSIIVSYANEGARTKIDELKKVKFSKRSNKAAQGDKLSLIHI